MHTDLNRERVTHHTSSAVTVGTVVLGQCERAVLTVLLTLWEVSAAGLQTCRGLPSDTGLQTAARDMTETKVAPPDLLTPAQSISPTGLLMMQCYWCSQSSHNFRRSRRFLMSRRSRRCRRWCSSDDNDQCPADCVCLTWHLSQLYLHSREEEQEQGPHW